MIGVIDDSTPDLADGRVLYSLALVVLDDFAADTFRTVLRNSFQRKGARSTGNATTVNQPAVG